MHMTNRNKLMLLIGIMLGLIGIYLFLGLEGNTGYILTRRATRMLAIMTTGAVIAVATVIFQTITNNRLLTPSLIGLDSLYQLLQTFIIFFYGSTSITIVNQKINFIISIALMIVFALVLFKILFKRNHNVYLILLIGLIFGTFFQSFT